MLKTSIETISFLLLSLLFPAISEAASFKAQGNISLTRQDGENLDFISTSPSKVEGCTLPSTFATNNATVTCMNYQDVSIIFPDEYLLVGGSISGKAPVGDLDFSNPSNIVAKATTKITSSNLSFSSQSIPLRLRWSPDLEVEALIDEKASASYQVFLTSTYQQENDNGDPIGNLITRNILNDPDQNFLTAITAPPNDNIDADFTLDFTIANSIIENNIEFQLQHFNLGVEIKGEARKTISIPEPNLIASLLAFLITNIIFNTVKKNRS